MTWPYCIQAVVHCNFYSASLKHGLVGSPLATGHGTQASHGEFVIRCVHLLPPPGLAGSSPGCC